MNQIPRRPPAFNPKILKNKINPTTRFQELPPLYEMVIDNRPSAPPPYIEDINSNEISTQTDRRPKVPISMLSLNDFTEKEKEDILDYGIYLGVDLNKYSFCLKYVISSINSKLPKGWKEYLTNEGDIYYYNNKLDESTWYHPLDNYYKEVIKSKIKEYKKKSKICTIM